MKSEEFIKNQLKNYLFSKKLISKNATWRIQAGGMSNKVWRITDEKDLICKLYSDIQTNPLFNNNPIAEYKCLLWLEGEKIAPKAYKLLETPLGKVLLYFYVDGSTWIKDISAVADLLNRIHGYKPLKELRVLSETPDSIINDGLYILKNVETPHKNALLKLRPTASVSRVEPVMIHTDVVVGNLICANDGLRLIDWQCPALGDPVVDITMFLSPGMHLIYGSKKFNMSDYESFLMNLNPHLSERYRVLGPLYHWRLAAYCFWKAEQGNVEYKNAARAEIDLLKLI